MKFTSIIACLIIITSCGSRDLSPSVISQSNLLTPDELYKLCGYSFVVYDFGEHQKAREIRLFCRTSTATYDGGIIKMDVAGKCKVFWRKTSYGIEYNVLFEQGGNGIGSITIPDINRYIRSVLLTSSGDTIIGNALLEKYAINRLSLNPDNLDEQFALYLHIR